MESAKAGIVAGEGKAATSERSSFGEICCGAPESVEAVTKKKVAVEQTGKAHGALERGAQYGCMPVVSKAGNRVTWNHSFLAGHHRGGGACKSPHPLADLELLQQYGASFHRANRLI